VSASHETANLNPFAICPVEKKQSGHRGRGEKNGAKDPTRRMGKKTNSGNESIRRTVENVRGWRNNPVVALRLPLKMSFLRKQESISS
jgi:hypothetical protein